VGGAEKAGMRCDSPQTVGMFVVDFPDQQALAPGTHFGGSEDPAGSRPLPGRERRLRGDPQGTKAKSGERGPLVMIPSCGPGPSASRPLTQVQVQGVKQKLGGKLP